MLKKFLILTTGFIYLLLSPATAFAVIQNNIVKENGVPNRQICGNDTLDHLENTDFISQIEYPKEILPNKEFTVYVTFNNKLPETRAFYMATVTDGTFPTPIATNSRRQAIDTVGRVGFEMTVKANKPALLKLYLTKNVTGPRSFLYPLGQPISKSICLGTIRLIDTDFANVRCSLDTPTEVQAGKKFSVKYDIQPRNANVKYVLTTYQDANGAIGQPSPFNWDHMSVRVNASSYLPAYASQNFLTNETGEFNLTSPVNISDVKNYRVYIIALKTTAAGSTIAGDGFICGYTDIALKGPHETVTDGEQTSEAKLPPGAEISGTAIGKGICTLNNGDREGSFSESDTINFNMDNFIEEGKQACVILESDSGKKLVVDKPPTGKTSTIDTQGQAHLDYNPFFVGSDSKLIPGKYSAKFYVNCYTSASKEVCQDKPVSIDISEAEEKLCTVPEGIQPKESISFSAQKLTPNQSFRAYITNSSTGEIVSETLISGTSNGAGDLSMLLGEISNPGSYGVSLNTVNADGSEENACKTTFEIGANRCFVDSGLKSSSVVSLKAVGVQSGKQYSAFVTKRGDSDPLNKTPVNGPGDSNGRFQVNYPDRLENGDYTFSLNDGSKNFCFYEFNIGSSERDVNLEDTYAKYDTKCAGSDCIKSAGEACSTTDDPSVRDGIKTAIGCFPTNPAGIMKAGVKIGVSAGGGIALLMMVFGAFRMITSAGNPETIKKGQEQFTSAIIGLLFIIFSVLLLEIIGVDILNLPGFGR